jgi:hypothetical protein
MRLPNFYGDVVAENYSPQVERLFAEWERYHTMAQKAQLLMSPKGHYGAARCSYEGKEQ